MKKPMAVYAGVVLLILQLVQVALIVLDDPDPHGYPLGGYRALIAGILLTGLFFWKPRFGRWYVIPYLLALGIRTYRETSDIEVQSWHVFWNMTAAAMYVTVAMWLFRLPPLYEKSNSQHFSAGELTGIPNQPPQTNAGSRPPSDDSPGSEPPSSPAPRG